MSNYIDDSDSDPAYQHKIGKGIFVGRRKYFHSSKHNFDKGKNKNVKTRELDYVSVNSSQDFALKLSDNSVVEDEEIEYGSAETNIMVEDGEIIVINDSSIDSSDQYLNTNKEPINNLKSSKDNSESTSKTRGKVVISYDHDKTVSENEKCFKESRGSEQNKILSSKNVIKQTILQKNPQFYTSSSSDSSLTSNSSFYNKKIGCNEEVDKSGSTHISPTPQLLNTKLQNTLYSINNKSSIKSAINFIPRKIAIDNRDTISSKSNSINFESPQLRKDVHNSSPKTPSSLTKLTRKDVKNIFKNIESRKILYQSPREKKNDDLVVDETLDEEMHPALLSTKPLTTSTNKAPTNFIDETISDSGQMERQNPQIELFNLHELNEENQPYKTLSERKKKEISEWLMTNTGDCQSDSSYSYIPPSSRNSLDSGNSSLERLEMNYETPNNRGKILKNKINDGNSKSTVTNLNRKDNVVLPRKTTDKCLENTKNIPALPVKSVNNSVPRVKSVKQNTQNIDVLDCADILDKLYGNTWRNKAQALLQTPIQKVQSTITKDRAVQTERKALLNIRRSTGMSRGRSKPRSAIAKTVKPCINSTKNSGVKCQNQRNNFINDWSSSDSENQTYHTALTHPRTSIETLSHKPFSATGSLRRAIVISSESDSKSESSSSKDMRDYESNLRKNTEKILNRRRLSFSDDESSKDNTSEFDPEDEVPEKRRYQKNTPKPIENRITEKNRNIFSFDVKDKKEKHKSFLASLSDAVPLANAHSDARKFRQSFKNNKDELCNYLFKLYNEKVFENKLPKDMKIEWNVRMRGTAGFCYNKRSLKPLGGIARSSRIVLATKILDTPDRLRDTLIHEMCHAAAWLINDVSDGHGPFWTAWANKAMKVFPELPPIRRCHDYKINTKFTYKCMDCGYSIGRHSKSLDVERKRCGYCYGKFELLVNKTTKSGTVQMQTPKREPSAFALFVKENYSSVKKERNAKHAEVMKILGQQFSAIKIAQKHDNNIETNEDILD